jgi:heme/copper-type cytochrome/quinol oxidase subunit 2
MAGTLALALFWIAAVATVVAHVFIVRGTVRAMRAAPPDSPARGAWEWVWTFIPAIAVAVLLVATWYAMHPTTFHITLPADRLIPGAFRS